MTEDSDIVEVDGELIPRQLYETACDESQKFIDEYSNYGVGVVLVVRYEKDNTIKHKRYSSHNIRLSGMQVTMHAEQLCLFNALMDISELDDPTDATLDSMAVVTTGNDMAVKCGHCLQVASSVASYTDTDPSTFDIMPAKKPHKNGNEDNPKIWLAKEFTLDELIGDTYVTNRD